MLKKKYADKSNIRIHASTINFMDANYQKIKQMRVQNENSAPKNLSHQMGN
jgi:hypothetical protein